MGVVEREQDILPHLRLPYRSTSLVTLLRRQPLQQHTIRTPSQLEAAEPVEFVGRMDAFVGEAEAEVDGVDAQVVQEEATDRDAAAAAGVERLLAVEFQMHVACGHVAEVIGGHEIGRGLAGDGSSR